MYHLVVKARMMLPRVICLLQHLDTLVCNRHLYPVVKGNACHRHMLARSTICLPLLLPAHTQISASSQVALPCRIYAFCTNTALARLNNLAYESSSQYMTKLKF